MARKKKKKVRIHADWLIETLVGVVNESQEDGPSITLAIGGMLVSGQMVTAERYYRAVLPFADKQITDAMKELREEDSMYIHLQKAQFFFSGDAPPIPTTSEQPDFFRAKLSAVDGFMTARLAVAKT